MHWMKSCFSVWFWNIRANSVSFIEGFTLVSPVFVGTACPSDCKYVYFHVPLFVMANIYKCFECNSLNVFVVMTSQSQYMIWHIFHKFIESILHTVHCVFYILLKEAARCWKDPPFLATAMYVYFHILLFVMANILLYISGLLSYSVICNGKYFYSNMNKIHKLSAWLWHNKDNTCIILCSLLLKEAARCCRPSLERPALPSGSQVGLFSDSVFLFWHIFH